MAASAEMPPNAHHGGWCQRKFARLMSNTSRSSTAWSFTGAGRSCSSTAWRRSSSSAEVSDVVLVVGPKGTAPSRASLTKAMRLPPSLERKQEYNFIKTADLLAWEGKLNFREMLAAQPSMFVRKNVLLSAVLAGELCEE